MAKPFRIHMNSIADEPLSVQETARKYGVSSSELKKVTSFIKSRVTSNGRKTSRGHK